MNKEMITRRAFADWLQAVLPAILLLVIVT